MLLRPSVQHQAEAGRRPELTFEHSIPMLASGPTGAGKWTRVARTAKPFAGPADLDGFIASGHCPGCRNGWEKATRDD